MRAALALCLILAGCAHVPTRKAPSAGPVIRVALTQAASEVRVGSASAWRVAFEGRSETPLDAPAGSVWTFTFDRSTSPPRIRVEDATGVDRGAHAGPLVFYPEVPGTFMTVGGSSYRGYLVVTPASGGLLVVNRLRMEDYVPGVVGNEIGKTGGDLEEAVKAQAVAARTYALIRSGVRTSEPFDVTSDHLDQVYSGVGGESDAVMTACRETAGEVIMLHGKPVEAVYSSTCGGRTAGRSEVWGEGDQPHLRSRRDRRDGHDLCQASPLYRWKVAWTAGEFMRIVRANCERAQHDGPVPDGTLRSVKVKGRSSSGRVKTLEIECEHGRCRFERDAIRWVLRQPKEGFPLLPSTAFEVKTEKRDGRVETVIAEGRGYGHGVGMCQFGAMALSRQRTSYRDILAYYYHDVKVRRAY